MYRLYPLTHVATHGDRLCIISDEMDSLRLHTVDGKLPALVKSLTTGFRKKLLFRMLDPQHHPVWGHEALWLKLTPFLFSAPAVEKPRLDRFSEFTRYSTEITHSGRDALWARQQQVIHVPVLSDITIAALNLLIQAGFEAFISYDDALVTSADVGPYLLNRHIGEPKIDAVRNVVVAKNSNVMLGSPAVFSHQNIDANHHVLWHFDASGPEQTETLRRISAGLRILPVQSHSSTQLVGPVIQADTPPCWDCYQRYYHQLGPVPDPSISPTAYQLSLMSSAVLKYFQELSSEWLLSQKHGHAAERSSLSTTALMITDALGPVPVPVTNSMSDCVCHLASQ